MPFFLPHPLFRSAAYGHVFCMPSRYDQKGMVAFPRSSVQLKAFVYLACVASLYVAVFLFGAAWGQMVCQSWSAKAKGAHWAHVLMAWPQHTNRSWVFCAKVRVRGLQGYHTLWLLVWDFGMPRNLGHMGKVLRCHKDGRFGRTKGTRHGELLYQGQSCP